LIVLKSLGAKAPNMMGDYMPDETQQYENKEVRAVRGLVAKTIASWEREGWELVSQEEGKLQTKLNFRRPKKKLPLKALVIGGVTIAAILTTIITIGAITESKSDPAAETAQAEATTTSTEPSATTVETTIETLTIENNADLAALLASNGEDLALNEAFYKKYGNALIEFDGNIAYMAPHGDYKTRYDALIQAGDYSETKLIGPPFRVVDVNYYDFHLSGPNAPDSVRQSDNIRVIGRITGWKDPAFTMEIVSTAIR
jgi:hypothetical protein